MVRLDETDRKIFLELQSDANQSFEEIAKKANPIPNWGLGAVRFLGDFLQ